VRDLPRGAMDHGVRMPFDTGMQRHRKLMRRDVCTAPLGRWRCGGDLVVTLAPLP
jgi:hypothetical protein